MEKSYLINNREIKFLTGTAVSHVSGKRVDAVAMQENGSHNGKITTDTDWIPQDKEEAVDMLENYNWEISNELTDFWPDDEQ
jgi:hypothetical protein